MNHAARHQAEDSPDALGMWRLCWVAVVCGVVIGFVGGAFRWCLRQADERRLELLEWVHSAPAPALLIPVAVTAGGAGLAALIVRWTPLAAGSGIQHVEAVARGESQAPPRSVLPAKFIGGLLSIGSGLVLGREGPTVHMGAAIGAEAGRRARLSSADSASMQSSVAGAGLAVAFNAPIGGAVFVFEEVTKSFRARTVLPTLIAVAVGVGCSRMINGDRPDFFAGGVDAPSIALLPYFVVFGLTAGVLGVLYSKMILGAVDVAERFDNVSPTVRAVLIGALVGALMTLDQGYAGGGDAVVQSLIGGGNPVVPVVAGFLVIRLITGPLSYASATPGGLFAPLLALGALWGALVAGVGDAALPDMNTSSLPAMVVVGMAALFGAVVRAPITGIVIVVEMTAVTSVTVPMLAATAAAVLVAHLAGSPPIYDSLRHRMLGDGRR